MIAQTRFWLVWNLSQYGRMPYFQHQTKLAAEVEAKRLASEHPGQVFYVVETVAAARKQTVEFVRYEGDSIQEIPF